MFRNYLLAFVRRASDKGATPEEIAVLPDVVHELGCVLGYLF